MLVEILVDLLVTLLFQMVEVVSENLHFFVDLAIATMPLPWCHLSFIFIFDSPDVLLDEIAVSLSLLLLLLLC